jgi:hypothetical protein
MIDLMQTIARYFSADGGPASPRPTETFQESPWDEDIDTGRALTNSRAPNSDAPAEKRDANGTQYLRSHEQATKRQRSDSIPAKNNANDDGFGPFPGQDRIRMPPPLIQRKRAAGTSPQNSEGDAGTMVTSGTRLSKQLDSPERRKMLQAHVDSFHIEPDSGFWYQSEAGLYAHLYLRGTEAVMPVAWQPDFKTYPLELFEYGTEEVPLIVDLSLTQFHALRALREIVGLGQKVRDLVQGGQKTPKIQKTIQKSIQAYITWALSDADLYPTPATVPVHCIMQRQPKQDTANAISSLACKMHALLKKHKQPFPDDCAPYQPLSPLSLKRHTKSASPDLPICPRFEGNPQIQDDSQGHHPPVIIGLLIVGMTVTIFTLNAKNAKEALARQDATIGIHMLGRFNFKEGRYDVWNGLAIALTACHLRHALRAPASPVGASPGLRYNHGDVAGYVSRQEYKEARKRKWQVMYEQQQEEEAHGHNEVVAVADHDQGKQPVRMDVRKRRRLVEPEDSDPDR